MADAELSLTKAGQKQLDRLLEKFDAEYIKREIKEPLMTKLSLQIAGHISKSKLSGQLLKVRTGNLRRAMTGRSVQINGMPGFRVGIFNGPQLAYAGIQEHGGIVKKKPGGPNLAMPVGSRALTPAGVPKFKSARFYNAGELHYIPAHKNPVVGLLFDERSIRKDGQPRKNARAEYILLTRITIKGKHYLRDGMQDKLDFVAKSIGRRFKEILESE